MILCSDYYLALGEVIMVNNPCETYSLHSQNVFLVFFRSFKIFSVTRLHLDKKTIQFLLNLLRKIRMLENWPALVHISPMLYIEGSFVLGIYPIYRYSDTAGRHFRTQHL